MAGSLLRRGQYDRRQLLTSAEKARKKGKARRAIKAYLRILEVEPHDTEINWKIAPLLARVGQRRAAMKSFAEAIQGLLRGGFEQDALSLCREAAAFYPRQVELWEEIARLRLKASSTADSMSALLEGRSHFRRRKYLPEALRLLERAHAIDPENLAVSFDLSRVLRRSGKRDQARTLLAALERHTSGRMLRRVRFAQFRNDPAVRTAWALLRGVTGHRRHSSQA